MSYFARLTRELNKDIVIDEQKLSAFSISSVKFLSGVDVVEIYEKDDNIKEKYVPISQMKRYQKFYVGKYYSEKNKEKFPKIYSWGPEVKKWDGICKTFSRGVFHAIPDREDYPVIEQDQIKNGFYSHNHGDKTYFIKFFKKSSGKTITWTDRLESLDFSDVKFDDDVFKFRTYAKNDSWETVDKMDYIIGRFATEKETQNLKDSAENNDKTFLKTRTGNLISEDKDFTLIAPELIQNGKFVKSERRLSVKYYRHLKGDAEAHWEEDCDNDKIENIVFKQGIYRVKFCYKSRDGKVRDEQEYIVGKEISASEAQEKYPAFYNEYKDKNPRFIETSFGVTIVRCAKCVIIDPEQLVDFKFDPYKDKDYINLE